MWNIAEIPERFEPVRALADKHGYVAAIFGSVVRAGAGRDLDILMLRRFREPSDWKAFLAEFGGATVRTFERGERRNHSYEVERDGKLYHFIFGSF